MRGCTLLLALVPLLGIRVVARAQARPRPARLEYSAVAPREGCPDESAFRAIVASRVGIDPFAPDAAWTVVVRVGAGSAGSVARLRVISETGVVRVERELVGGPHGCLDAVEAVALQVSLWLDPVLQPEPDPPATPVPSSTVETSPPAPPPTVSPPPSPARPPVLAAPLRTPEDEAAGRWSLLLGIDATLSAGLEPNPTFGASIRVGARRPPWTLLVEGEALLPSSESASDGSGVEATLLLGLLAPCFQPDRFGGCLVVGLGTLRGRGFGVEQPRRDDSLLVLAGARVAAVLPLVGPLGLSMHADLLASVVPVSLRLAGVERWSSPPVAASAAVGLLGSWQ